jgi:hypothetical protein
MNRFPIVADFKTQGSMYVALVDASNDASGSPCASRSAMNTKPSPPLSANRHTLKAEVQAVARAHHNCVIP